MHTTAVAKCPAAASSPNRRLIVLTNIAQGNAYTAAVRQRFVELLFDANEEAEKAFAFGLKQTQESIKKQMEEDYMRSLMLISPEAMRREIRRLNPDMTEELVEATMRFAERKRMARPGASDDWMTT